MKVKFHVISEIVAILILTGSVATACQKKTQANKNTNFGGGNTKGTISFKVESAPGWSALFKRNSGWFGADGIYTIPLNGVEAPGKSKNQKTMFVFSDTMIGEIKGGKLQDGFSMVHNSVAYLQGDQPNPEHMKFYWKKTSNGKPTSLFKPETKTAQKGDYYWLGDGFADQALNDDIYLFAYRIRSTKRGLGFKVVGNELIVIPAGSKPPFNDQRQIETPLFMKGNGVGSVGTFGAGIFVNTKSAGAPFPDGYVYIYGVKGKDKELITARVKPENIENFAKWRFWDGSGWNPQESSVQAITERVSNELSIYPIAKNKYIAVFQVDGISNKVGLRIGKSPVGPFGDIQDVWTIREHKKDSSFYTYNAKAHPSLSKPGELLISYNVNSYDFFRKIKEYPHLYRPRFIRVTFKNEGSPRKH
jgi:hypothetical protein